MAAKGRPPRGSDGIASWTHDRCPSGHNGVGWIAGDVHGVLCHSSRASKPCRKLYLGEHEECEGCKKHMGVDWLGYVPLYRYDGRPVFVIIHEHQLESVASLGLHTYVSWHREEGRGESVAVLQMDKQKAWYSTLPEKNRPACLARFLPKLWRMPDMTPVCLKEFGVSDNPVSPDTRTERPTALEEIHAVEADSAEKMRAILRRALPVKPQEPSTVGDLVDGMMNGKHRRK